VFFRAKFQLGRVTLSRLRSSYRSKYRKRIFWLNLTFWSWNFKWTLIAALATGDWQFGPCRYVLIWLPPLNKKCHLQLNSEFWPADYKGNFTDSKKYILPKRPAVRTVSVTHCSANYRRKQTQMPFAESSVCYSPAASIPRTVSFV